MFLSSSFEECLNLDETVSLLSFGNLATIVFCTLVIAENTVRLWIFLLKPFRGKQLVLTRFVFADFSLS